MVLAETRLRSAVAPATVALAERAELLETVVPVAPGDRLTPQIVQRIPRSNTRIETRRRWLDVAMKNNSRSLEVLGRLVAKRSTSTRSREVALDPRLVHDAQKSFARRSCRAPQAIVES